jgi:hypothetical protein
MRSTTIVSAAGFAECCATLADCIAMLGRDGNLWLQRIKDFHADYAGG